MIGCNDYHITRWSVDTCVCDECGCVVKCYLSKQEWGQESPEAELQDNKGGHAGSHKGQNSREENELDSAAEATDRLRVIVWFLRSATCWCASEEHKSGDE